MLPPRQFAKPEWLKKKVASDYITLLEKVILNVVIESEVTVDTLLFVVIATNNDTGVLVIAVIVNDGTITYVDAKVRPLCGSEVFLNKFTIDGVVDDNIFDIVTVTIEPSNDNSVE